MKTKKTLAIVLALIMMLTLAACNGSENVTPSTGSPSGSPAVETNDVDATAPESTEPETTDPESTEPETTDPEPADPATTDPESTDGISVGEITETQYTNEALGIVFTLAEDWRFATNEEIALALQIGIDIVADDAESFRQMMQEQPFFFDVMALDSTGMKNFNINYNDMVQMGLPPLMSESSISAATEMQFKDMSTYRDAEFEQGTHNLGSMEYVTLSIDATETPLGMYQRQYYKKLDTHLVIITISGISMESVDGIADMFEPFE